MLKNLLFFIAVFILALPVLADCNLKMATAAGQYIAELEKARLQRYQNNSVCEVLNYEFWNCSKPQKEKLKKSFDVKQVLGNYCQPHLPPPKQEMKKEEWMKGGDLYTWKDCSGYYWYALLPGTNRNKTTKELIENKVNEGYLKELIAKAPQNTELSWNNLSTISDKEKLDFSLPPTTISTEIKNAAELAKLKLDMRRSQH